MAIRSSFGEDAAAPSASVLPTRNTDSRPPVNAMPIHIGLPGSASQTLSVQGVVNDLAGALVLALTLDTSIGVLRTSH